MAIEAQLQVAPNDAALHAQLALMLAYLNRKEDAIREGKRSLSLPPTLGSDTLYFQHQLARIYIEVGEPAKALDLLGSLLRAPYALSPAWLKIDPNFNALHGNPRFEQLVAGS
jgi:tetratricopeptide (TPR) repeat protein